MSIRKKFLATLLCVLTLCGVMGIGASAAVWKEGTYTGVYERVSMSGVGIRYEISAAFADGQYSYDVRVQLLNGEYDGQDSTKFGTYTINGETMTMTGGNLTSAVVGADGSLTVSGTLSSFAFAPADVTLTWTSADKPKTDTPDTPQEPKVYAFTQGANGNYALSASADYVLVCDGALDQFTKATLDGVVLPAEAYTLEAGPTKMTIRGSVLQTLSAGLHRIVFTYTDGESETATLRVAATAGTYPDMLQSGRYELVLDDFDDRVGVHRHPCIITIDRKTETFMIHDTDDPVTDKGSGTLAFDDATGEYTMTYTAGGPETQTDPATTFRVEQTDLVFTSPLKLGRSMMNIRDDSGRFISYTAKQLRIELTVASAQSLYAKESMPLDVQIEDNGASCTLTYTSSNAKVATVDQNGKVTAHMRGTADITVTVTDEDGNAVSDTCTVTVHYTLVQWLIVILLFGWIWY